MEWFGISHDFTWTGEFFLRYPTFKPTVMLTLTKKDSYKTCTELVAFDRHAGLKTGQAFAEFCVLMQFHRTGCRGFDVYRC